MTTKNRKDNAVQYICLITVRRNRYLIPAAPFLFVNFEISLLLRCLYYEGEEKWKQMNNLPESQDRDFIEIFNQHKDGIFLYALKMLGNRDSAGDIAQDVFMRLYQKQLNNSEILDVKSWLFVVARNLCLNLIRSRKKVGSLDELESAGVAAIDPSDEKLLYLRRALLSLEPQYREAIIFREYHGFSYSEIAEITGLTIPAVRSLLYRGRIELRAAFKKLNMVR